MEIAVKKRLIIFTDSLGRPRPKGHEGESTEYEDTYPFLLKSHFDDIFEADIIYIDSLDTIDAQFWNERMVAYRRPDIVIYHIGINDCAKRILKKNTDFIVFKSWFPKQLKTTFLFFLTKIRPWLIRNIIKNKVYVDEVKFEGNINSMVSKVNEYSKPNIFFIGISRKPRWYEKKSPGINKNINLYNTILKTIFKEKFINIHENTTLRPEEYLISDGIHFTKASHKLAFDILKNALNKCAE